MDIADDEDENLHTYYIHPVVGAAQQEPQHVLPGLFLFVSVESSF